MTAELQKLMAETEELSEAELAILQEHIAKQLSKKTTTKPNLSYRSQQQIYLPTPTSEEIEVELSEIFTPEELAAMEKVDLDDLPPLPKPLSEYINEDREDRF